MDQQQATIVSLTDNAAAKVKELMEQEGEEDLALRIGVRPGGCSGFQYSIYFDDEVEDDDEVIEDKGVKVLIDAMSVPYIMGSEFDYVDGLMGAGFAVNNPNVQGGCGCGGLRRVGGADSRRREARGQRSARQPPGKLAGVVGGGGLPARHQRAATGVSRARDRRPAA